MLHCLLKPCTALLAPQGAQYPLSQPSCPAAPLTPAWAPRSPQSPHCSVPSIMNILFLQPVLPFSALPPPGSLPCLPGPAGIPRSSPKLDVATIPAAECPPCPQAPKGPAQQSCSVDIMSQMNEDGEGRILKNGGTCPRSPGGTAEGPAQTQTLVSRLRAGPRGSGAQHLCQDSWLSLARLCPGWVTSGSHLPQPRSLRAASLPPPWANPVLLGMPAPAPSSLHFCLHEASRLQQPYLNQSVMVEPWGVPFEAPVW